MRVAVVEITLTDGTQLSERVTAVRGTPRNPMTRKEVVDKARDLIDPVLGSATGTRLVETIFALEERAQLFATFAPCYSGRERAGLKASGPRVQGPGLSRQ